jgi:hypothetical protein
MSAADRDRVRARFELNLIWLQNMAHAEWMNTLPRYAMVNRMWTDMPTFRGAWDKAPFSIAPVA